MVVAGEWKGCALAADYAMGQKAACGLGVGVDGKGRRQKPKHVGGLAPVPKPGHSGSLGIIAVVIMKIAQANGFHFTFCSLAKVIRNCLTSSPWRVGGCGGGPVGGRGSLGCRPKLRGWGNWEPLGLTSVSLSWGARGSALSAEAAFPLPPG